jgi:hypothetical protein
MNIYARLTLLSLFAVAGCSNDAPAPDPGPIPRLCVETPAFTLTPAPKFETPLQKWKRTKADYESQSKAIRDLTSRLDQQYYPALEAYVAAEKELQSAQCGKICVPEKTPQ